MARAAPPVGGPGARAASDSTEEFGSETIMRPAAAPVPERDRRKGHGIDICFGSDSEEGSRCSQSLAPRISSSSRSRDAGPRRAPHSLRRRARPATGPHPARDIRRRCPLRSRNAVRHFLPCPDHGFEIGRWVVTASVVRRFRRSRPGRQVRDAGSDSVSASGLDS